MARANSGPLILGMTMSTITNANWRECVLQMIERLLSVSCRSHRISQRRKKFYSGLPHWFCILNHQQRFTPAGGGNFNRHRIG